MITKEQYDNHDCHLSPHDSCSACEAWFEQEFNSKYAEGDFDDRMIEDDKLPDLRDIFVVQMVREKQKELEKNDATDRPETV